MLADEARAGLRSELGVSHIGCEVIAFGLVMGSAKSTTIGGIWATVDRRSSVYNRRLSTESRIFGRTQGCHRIGLQKSRQGIKAVELVSESLGREGLRVFAWKYGRRNMLT